MESDPRVFFASERTLLAWLRTGIAVAGLGFVVSRFGLFLRLLAAQAAGGPAAAGQSSAHWIGIALVAIGALCMIVATIQHGRFIATLPARDRPARYSTTWALWLAGLMSAGALLLAAYLAQTPA